MIIKLPFVSATFIIRQALSVLIFGVIPGVCTSGSMNIHVAIQNGAVSVASPTGWSRISIPNCTNTVNTTADSE